MDKRVLRERMRRKRRQRMIRKYTRLGIYAAVFILAVVFLIRGIIIPIAQRIGGGGGDSGTTVEVQAETAAADPNAAIRQPLKGEADVAKVTAVTPGWHDGESGRWYQNADGTYYTGGFQEIDGTTYSFDDNGYLQTGWVTKGVKDYYFNDDGTYDSTKKRPMLALTFDDGPGQYTDTLLDCLEENNAHATFFMLGQNVEAYPDVPKRVLELGCEIGSHSWDHLQLTTLDMDAVAKEFTDTDDALIKACGQAATVARAPYGSGSTEIFQTVGKPFFMWSLDSLDWSYLDVDMDYNSVMQGDLTDGTIILMHDIHEPSVQAALRIIPDLVAQGYKLVTVSELAEAKGVTLQAAEYVDFWDSTLASGSVAGYEGNTTSTDTTSEDTSSEDTSEDSSDAYSDGTEDSSDEYSDGSEDTSSDDYSDGSSDESYDSSYDESYSEE